MIRFASSSTFAFLSYTTCRLRGVMFLKQITFPRPDILPMKMSPWNFFFNFCLLHAPALHQQVTSS